MGVMIKGMGMPDGCAYCYMEEGRICFACAEPKAIDDDMITVRQDWCPIQVIENHGRLIDADKLYRVIKAECNPYGKPTIGFEDGKKVLDMIDKMPTIIPAEKEGEVCPCRKQSNADRIRTMTDEELAYFLTSEDFCALLCGAPLVCDGNCALKAFEWLQKEAKEEGE